MKDVIEKKVAELKGRYPGYHIVVIYWGHATIELKGDFQWIAQEKIWFKDDGGILNPAYWHYEAFVVARGKLLYDSAKNWMKQENQ
jgi:hypothetical protein